ncbi:TRAP transporter substrate-binding protein [Ammoniphilus sp. YIM 78166]|uniref:TRAP transporter substrate-binding protein n=1 Tax=Ammoniphilus sp. YIM 78166 TaxID=1644106 RepID=UPI0010705720|nr:TRAP transporter substrate-binding protein [Ammoniphilus sp. YIM 78166]
MRKFGKGFSQVFGLCLSAAVLLVGCGGNTQGTAQPSPSAEQPASVEQPAKDAKLIRVSHNMPTDSGPDKAAHKFKEVVENKSNGSLKVEIYGNSQLGSMREQTESVQMGSIEMTIQPISTLTPFVNDLQVVDFPFLWPNEETMFKVLDGEAGQQILSTMEDAGFKGLGFWASGFKAITSNKQIQSPEDLKGVKMRVIPSPLLIAQYQAWGANPVPVDFAELYNSLQQGVVDGQENPLETIFMQKYYEVQKNLTVANHGYLAYISTMNKSFFDSLTQEEQQLLIEAEKEARDLGRDIADQMASEYLKKLEETGLQVTVLNNEQREAFRTLSLPVHQEFSKTDRQKQILEKVYEEVEAAQ